MIRSTSSKLIRQKNLSGHHARAGVIGGMSCTRNKQASPASPLSTQQRQAHSNGGLYSHRDVAAAAATGKGRFEGPQCLGARGSISGCGLAGLRRGSGAMGGGLVARGSIILGGRRDFWWRNRLSKKTGDGTGNGAEPAAGELVNNGDSSGNADSAGADAFQDAGGQSGQWPSQSEPLFSNEQQWRNNAPLPEDDGAAAGYASVTNSPQAESTAIGTGAPSSSWTNGGASPAHGLDQSAATMAPGAVGEQGAELGMHAGAVADVGSAAAATVSPVGELTMWPHHLLMQLLEYVHVTAGIPYWQAIIATTVAARFAVMPLVISSTAMGARMMAAKPELDPIQQKVKVLQTKMSATKNTDEKNAILAEMQDTTREIKAVWRKHKIKPMNGLYGFAQMPVFVGLFFATRNMAEFYPAYTEGGPAWALDLSAVDPTYAMAFFTWVSMQALCEMGTGMPPVPGQVIDMRLMMRVMGFVTLPVSFTMPVGTLMYWMTANIVYIAQRKLVLDNPVAKRYLGIPILSQAPAGTPKYQGSAETEHSSTWQSAFSSKMEERRHDPNHATESRDVPDSLQLAREREAVAKEARARHEELRREHETLQREHQELLREHKLKQNQAAAKGQSRPWDRQDEEGDKDDARRP